MADTKCLCSNPVHIFLLSFVQYNTYGTNLQVNVIKVSGVLAYELKFLMVFWKVIYGIALGCRGVYTSAAYY